MDVNFEGYDCEVVFGQYFNGNTAIQLIDNDDKELVSVASVNGELKLAEGVVGLKIWSENEGIVQALIDGGIIEPELLGMEPTGFVVIEYYKLTKKAIEEFEYQKNKAR